MKMCHKDAGQSLLQREMCHSIVGQRFATRRVVITAHEKAQRGRISEQSSQQMEICHIIEAVFTAEGEVSHPSRSEIYK